MNPMRWLKRLNAELAALHEAWHVRRERERILKFHRWRRRNRVGLPPPDPKAVANNWGADRRPPEARE